MNVRYLLSGVFAVAAIGLLGAYSSGAMQSKTACTAEQCTLECCPPGGCDVPCCADCPDCCDLAKSEASEAIVLPCCQVKAAPSCCAAKSAPADDTADAEVPAETTVENR